MKDLPDSFYTGYFAQLQTWEVEQEWLKMMEREIQRREVMELAELKRDDEQMFKQAYVQARNWLEAKLGYKLTGGNRKWDLNKWSWHFRKSVLRMARQMQTRAFERECWGNYKSNRLSLNDGI